MFVRPVSGYGSYSKGTTDDSQCTLGHLFEIGDACSYYCAAPPACAEEKALMGMKIDSVVAGPNSDRLATTGGVHF